MEWRWLDKPDSFRRNANEWAWLKVGPEDGGGAGRLAQHPKPRRSIETGRRFDPHPTSLAEATGIRARSPRIPTDRLPSVDSEITARLRTSSDHSAENHDRSQCTGGG